MRLLEFAIDKMYYVGITLPEHEGKKFTVLMSARNESGETDDEGYDVRIFFWVYYCR